MYERNAIVLERYFNQMFGYNMKQNIKTNFKDYSELVECLEKYKNISEEEDTIMQEYDSIANQIRDVQKRAEILNKKNIKYQEERAELFQNIDENANTIQRKMDNVNESINDVNEEIKANAQKFIEVVAEFTEKTIVRTECGKKRRNIENEYNNKLNDTLDNYKNIDLSIQKKAKQFIELDTEGIEKELKEKIKKNGEKEKIPFNSNVITKAIVLSIDIQKRETDVLASIYERTNKLFTEIKGNVIKNDKHLKTIKDSKCKLEFVGAIKEYLIQFLDNERLTIINGEDEHDKLMEEACKNLDEDLVQINNLYSLLLKEMSKKVTKKSYVDLYNLKYLKSLEVKAEEFDAEIKKLKLPVTIINPNYWRIEGMKKIYDVFYRCVTEEYGRDLSEYLIEEKIENNIEEDKNEEIELEKIESNENKNDNQKSEKKRAKRNEDKEIEEQDKSFEKEELDEERKKENVVKAEIDKKIDMILGLETQIEDEEDIETEEDNWEDEEFDNEEEIEDNWEDEDWEDEELDEDIEDNTDNEWDVNEEEDFEEEDLENDWGEDNDDWLDDEEDNWIEDSDEEEDEDEEEQWIEDNDDDWLDDDIDEEIENDWEENSQEEEDFEEDEVVEEEFKEKDNEARVDIWGNSISKKGKKSKKKDKHEEDNWEDEFVNIQKKKKNNGKGKRAKEKKGGFLSKFKK